LLLPNPQSQAQLLEQQSADVFQMSIGGIKAGQTITVRLTHVAVLRIVGDAVEVFIPTHVAPRYGGPAVAGAAAAVRTPLTVTVRCEMGSAITSIASETHAIAVELEDDKGAAAATRGAFSLAAATVTHLDKDFVALITTAAPHQPRLVIERSPTRRTCCAVLTIAPKLEFADCKCEFVFVVDRSGSMAGSNIEQARDYPFFMAQFAVMFGSIAHDHASFFGSILPEYSPSFP
jgi:hypothetical protein